jgi:hypothetical protein
MNNYKFDITVIGGGASGIMSSITAKRINPNLNVALIEGSFALGRKLLLSGAGRCNLTNINLSKKDYLSHYDSDNVNYIDRIFKKFDYNKICKYFEDLGINLFEEKMKSFGKIYPVSESSKNVVNILKEELNKIGVQVFLSTVCTGIDLVGNSFKILISKDGKKQFIDSSKVILTTGGMSYPSIGVYGKGYEIASKFGHKIIPCIPVAVPLLSKDKLCKNTAGVKVRAKLKSEINGTPMQEVEDDVLFTNYGLSGSGILRLSSTISKEFSINNNNVKIRIDFLPDISKEEFIKRMDTMGNERIWILLLGLLPSKLVDSILLDASISKEICIKDISIEQRKKLIDLLYDKTIIIYGTKGWNEAEFTAGGISMNEVNPETLESNFVKKLLFAGELLNVDGEIGGYNLSWAWASGFVAGKSSAI